MSFSIGVGKLKKISSFKGDERALRAMQQNGGRPGLQIEFQGGLAESFALAQPRLVGWAARAIWLGSAIVDFTGQQGKLGN